MCAAATPLADPPAASLTRVCINGRFLGRAMTGVDRFAGEMLRALDARVVEGDPAVAGLHFEVLAPAGTPAPGWLRAIPVTYVGRRGGQAWEQLELGRACGDDLLVNLCNTGPALRRRQLVVIHDVATFRVPAAYSRKFRAWYRVLTPRLYRRARLVATVSNFSRGELAELFGPRPDVRVLPEGVDHMARRLPDELVLDRHGLRGRRFVLAVSSLSPHKNFAVVVDAVARLQDAGIDVVVAGGQNPRVFSGGAALPDFVRYVGYVSDEELLALYRHAACFVFPSLYEGFGLPPVEAMACGTPVIAARAASMPEVCGGAALFFDPRDPASLADLIRRVSGDGALQAELAAKARGHVASLTWARAAEALLAQVRAGL